jgi:heterogeneous nuclear ribonucleoprotein K
MGEINFQNQKYNKNMDYTTELRLVHQSQAGCIIGRGGDKIKECMYFFFFFLLLLKILLLFFLKRYNLDMKVYSECAPLLTELIAQMKGKPNDIVNCLKEVLGLLETAPPKGMNRPYDPHHYNEFLASQYGGYLREKRGVGGGGVGGNERGGSSVRWSGGGGGGRGGMMGQSQFSQSNVANPNVTTNQVTIPNEVGLNNYVCKFCANNVDNFKLAGAIIGPRGTKIQQIREQSGAGISIDKPQLGSNDRIITITGGAEQIQNAQYLLQIT